MHSHTHVHSGCMFDLALTEPHGIFIVVVVIVVFPNQKHADKIRPARTSHQLEMAHNRRMSYM